MYIMLCFCNLFIGYLLFGAVLYFSASRLKLDRRDFKPIIGWFVFCGILFLGRMLIPHLSSVPSLWITIPDRLNNVDKTIVFQCSFDYLFLMCLILIGWIDYKKQIIPNVLNALILILGVTMQICTMILHWEMISEIVSLSERIIGMFILSVPLVIIGVLYKGSFGMGDVKLLAAAGFYLGWKGLLTGAFTGAFIAALLCIISLARHQIGLKDKIAFGLYLCVGMALVTILGWVN